MVYSEFELWELSVCDYELRYLVTFFQQVTHIGASMMGMFVIGSLIQRWVNITFAPVVSAVKQQEGAYIDWDKLPKVLPVLKPSQQLRSLSWR